MNKPLSYGKKESVASDSGASGVVSRVEGGGGGEGGVKPVSEGMPDQRVGVAPPESKGKPITLRGGKMPGSKRDEIVDTMSLAEAYALILAKPVSAVKKVCVECKQEIVGTWAYTNQDHAICQPCARKRAGL